MRKFGVLERMAQNIGILKRAENVPPNSSLLAAHASEANDPSRETMSEREFVRKFGSKVVHARYSGKPDFVGLCIYGRFTGFMVVRDSQGNRKVRLLDVLADKRNIHGRVHVTPRYLRVKSHESLSLLQRGLLRYVT